MIDRKKTQKGLCSLRVLVCKAYCELNKSTKVAYPTDPCSFQFSWAVYRWPNMGENVAVAREGLHVMSRALISFPGPSPGTPPCRAQCPALSPGAPVFYGSRVGQPERSGWTVIHRHWLAFISVPVYARVLVLCQSTRGCWFTMQGVSGLVGMILVHSKMQMCFSFL